MIIARYGTRAHGSASYTNLRNYIHVREGAVGGEDAATRPAQSSRRCGNSCRKRYAAEVEKARAAVKIVRCVIQCARRLQ